MEFILISFPFFFSSDDNSDEKDDHKNYRHLMQKQPLKNRSSPQQSYGLYLILQQRSCSGDIIIQRYHNCDKLCVCKWTFVHLERPIQTQQPAMEQPNDSHRHYVKWVQRHISSQNVLLAATMAWDAKQSSLLDQLRRTDVILGGDARYDSPGYSVKYGSYTLMDLQTKKILDFQNPGKAL